MPTNQPILVRYNKESLPGSRTTSPGFFLSTILRLLKWKTLGAKNDPEENDSKSVSTVKGYMGVYVVQYTTHHAKVEVERFFFPSAPNKSITQNYDKKIIVL